MAASMVAAEAWATAIAMLGPAWPGCCAPTAPKATLPTSLQRGFHPLLPGCADSDVAYTIKPAWASYIAFIDEVQADGAFQAEYGLSA